MWGRRREGVVVVVGEKGCRREGVFLEERRSVSVGEKECFWRREGIKKMCAFSIFLLARARIET